MGYMEGATPTLYPISENTGVAELLLAGWCLSHADYANRPVIGRILRVGRLRFVSQPQWPKDLADSQFYEKKI